jgi:four helix bundle protein
MARIESYKDLEAWRKAMQLVEACYTLTREFPPQEQYGMTTQLRRAAVSIPSNLAEGHNRGSKQAFSNHVSIALGSQAEVETQLELAVRLGFVKAGQAEPVQNLAAEVGRILHGLARALERVE